MFKNKGQDDWYCGAVVVGAGLAKTVCYKTKIDAQNLPF
jgi:hypothetical protein